MAGGLAWPRAPGTMEVLAAVGSWMAITLLLWGLLLALLILRRLRHLVVVLFVWIVQGLLLEYVLAPVLRRPRPFRVEYRTDWTGWAMPSEQMAALAVVLLGIIYALVPDGRSRQSGKWAGGVRWWRSSPSPAWVSGWRRRPTSWWASWSASPSHSSGFACSSPARASR